MPRDHPRYIVTVWHGELRSVAYVIDDYEEDMVHSYCSRIYGTNFKARAEAHAALLNEQA